MSEQKNDGRARSVPAHRISRLAGLGKLAAGIASRSMVEGAKRIGRGEIPRASELLLTSANITKVSDELARMRGAALKFGQLISMDAGEFLPRELAEQMARLRADADYMPETQLTEVLIKNWGADWHNQFEHFDLIPMAAASIGQVHRATTQDGRQLAIKVQYPGVARSIDSDMNNVVSLLSISGFAPAKAKLDLLVQEAKAQLKTEADYRCEAENIDRFQSHISGLSGFSLPIVQHDLSTGEILAMSFVQGEAIETAENLSQDIRNDIMTRLIELALKEIFHFGLVQTDPNFANYSYDVESGNIGLLDFGAMRTFSKETTDQYRQFLDVGLHGSRQELRALTLQIGLYSENTSIIHRNMIDKMVVYVFGALRQHTLFDFTHDDLLHDLQSIGTELALDRGFDDIPPTDILFLQRKAIGLFLLGRRLRAQLPLKEMLAKYTR